MKTFLSIFKNGGENISSIRVFTSLMILTACVYIVWFLITKQPIDFYGVSGFCAVALGGKVWQKNIELSNENETK
jgi:hypothetical protein